MGRVIENLVRLSLLALLAAVPWVYAESFTPDEAAVAAPVGDELTIGSQGAQLPLIERSPVTGELLAIFNLWTTNPDRKDPYYVVSKDGGEDWTDPAPIIPGGTPLADSASLALLYDGSKAHAVWIEIKASTGQFQVYYAGWNGTSWGPPRALSQLQDIPLQQVAIARTGANRITVLWDQENPTAPANQRFGIFQSETTDGGNNWSSSNVAFFLDAPILASSVVGDPSGNLHLAVEKQSPGGKSDIFYRKRTGTSWSAFLRLTTAPPLAGEVHQPEILIDDEHVHLVYSYRDVQDDQGVYLNSCSLTANCSVLGSWSAAASISGQMVGANNSDPFYVFPNLLSDGKDLVLLYHGIAGGQVAQKEVVWLTSDKCSAWPSVEPEGLTPTTMRGLNPHGAILNDGRDVGIVYEDGDTNKVYYVQVSNQCLAYYPVVIR